MDRLHLLAAMVDLSPLPNIGRGQDAFITDAITIVIRIVAALSLLFIVIGGFRYIMSQGEPQGVSKAKGTIVYALIGLAVAVLAQVIVSLIVGATK
jgi:hypothetical protein